MFADPPPRGWHPMTIADLPAVAAIAAVVHPTLPESPAVAADRLSLYPAGCLVLRRGAVATGYVLAHPGFRRAPPALDTCLGRLPACPDTFYVHDLALLPAARGTGAGGAIVRHLLALARHAGFPTVSLIAVTGSAPFWRRHGFVDAGTEIAPEKLRSYGAAARFMLFRPG